MKLAGVMFMPSLEVNCIWLAAEVIAYDRQTYKNLQKSTKEMKNIVKITVQLKCTDN